MRPTDRPDIVAPEVTLRIPGAWSGLEEFVERLTSNCRVTRDGFLVVDGAKFELNPLPAPVASSAAGAASAAVLAIGRQGAFQGTGGGGPIE